ncbi:MAG: thioredoxin [Selenomonadaceae bacterium]|nr:thioredoxin [Selenomonadaceae bacterium]
MAALRQKLWILAIALIAAGVWRGEHRAVLARAARICMECIGLG